MTLQKQSLNLFFFLGILLFVQFFANESGANSTSQSARFSAQFVELNELETKFNSHYIEFDRKQSTVVLEHFLIPLRFLELDKSKSSSENFEASMITERQGIKYVRWLIHPEDHRGVQEVMSWLRQNDLPIKREKYFLGLETASRSYLVLDPQTGQQFSLKTSTDMIGGKRVPRKTQTWKEARSTLQISDYIKQREAVFSGFKNFEVLEDPLVIGISDINRGMLIRSYRPLLTSDFHYVPAFAALNSEYGRWLAKKNGSDNPAEFWNEHLNKALARSFAELFVKTGLTVDSPHSQNFLIQLDANFRPTGKIILRDIGDMYFSSEYFHAEASDVKLLELQPREQIQRTGKLQVRIALLHYLWPPNWLDRFSRQRDSTSSYEQWGWDFYEEFQRELKSLTGVSLNSSRAKPIRSTDTFLNGYVLNDERAKSFFQAIQQWPNRAMACSSVFGLIQ